jgi:nucleoside-diphosphate-sugar epimerase
VRLAQTRHYTYGGDLARGIVTAMEHPAALNIESAIAQGAI